MSTRKLHAAEGVQDASGEPRGFAVRQSSAAFLLVRSGAQSAAHNMAIDEALLECVTDLNQPVLRFYGWSEPAATFGYFQRYKDVERLTHLRPLVRRPTGGGLVPHEADWTYSLVFPPLADWYQFKAVESYRAVHAWIKEAFARIGFAGQLAPQRAEEKAGQCFVGAEQFDVLWQNRKIAGAAQRRTKNGLLIQGSIQPPPGANRAQWENAFLEAAGLTWEPLCLDERFTMRAQELAVTKYSRDSYNQRR